MALRLRGATSGYIELKAPASAGDNTLTLPVNNGSANQLLKTDGSGNLSWVDDNSGVSLSGSTNNTIATVTGANALAGEANFTFDGDTAAITRSANTAAGLSISNTNNSQASAIAQLELSGGDNAHGRLQFECNGIYNTIRSDGNGHLKFFKGSDERLNISSVGDVAIGGCAVNTFNNYQTLTIGGARAVDGVGIDLEKSDGNIHGRLFADSNGLQIGVPQAGDYIRFEVESNEKIRIDSSGRLLIGVTASYANASIDELQIGNNNSSNQSGLTIGSTDECAIAFADAGDARAGSITYNHGTDAMIFKTVGQNERVRITSDGTVDVSDNVIIHSVGNSIGVDIEQQTDGNYMNMRLRNFYSGAAKNMIAFLDDAGNVDGSIVINNSTTTYNTSSDYRLKENEVLISDGIERLKLLKPYRFNYKKHPGITVDGFFAHEVTPAVPEAVINEKDGEIDKDGNGYQQMDYAKITPLLTAALKEAIAKIETLETKVAALESA